MSLSRIVAKQVHKRDYTRVEHGAEYLQFVDVEVERILGKEEICRRETHNLLCLISD